MCLKVVYDKKFKGCTGYKVLCCQDGKYYSGIMCMGKRIRITMSKFAQADTTQLSIDYNRDNGCYPGGFHIFTTLASAKQAFKDNWLDKTKVLCKVKFRKQVAYGTVPWSPSMLAVPTVVAQECRIIARKEV
jgi:hypothetical protein